jgi:hypothetical protein
MRPAHVPRLVSAFLVIVALAIAAVSCTEKVTPPEPPGPTPTMDAMPDSVQSIFTARCALSGCHVTGAAAFDEVLEAAVAYQRIVNVPSGEVPTLMRIRPGLPDSSYLVKKIRGDGDIVGGRMPLGPTPLTPAQIATISNWVTAGAPPTPVPVAAVDLLP